MIFRSASAATALLALSLAACSPDEPSAKAPAAKAVAAPAAQPATGADPAAQARADAINKALFLPTAAGAEPTGGAATANTTASIGAPTPDPMLLKAEVLLARAGFSPGVIDGTPGTNLRHAVAAFAQAQGLSDAEGELNAEVWARLNAPGAQPVAAVYTVTGADAAGPYAPDVGEDLWKLSKLDRAGYTSPMEALAERFHMSQEALQALNPGADFGKAGTALVAAQVGDASLPAIDHIEVDKANAALRGYDASDKLVAFAPATVGSTDRPSPSGTHKVKGVAKDPTYVYDPKKLTWGPRKHGKFTVPPGPNNPVGAVWIDLDAPSYGLHGSPDPKLIGKTGSHGCVRMTNWDALKVADAVKPGVVVRFLNERGG